MAKLNAPNAKQVIDLMSQQGRDSGFKTRKAVFNLHGLHKRLGEYRGTEAQNHALKNVMMHETPHRDTMLVKAKGGDKYAFDIPGGSTHTGYGPTPAVAQTNALQQFTVQTSYGPRTVNASSAQQATNYAASSGQAITGPTYSSTPASVSTGAAPATPISVAPPTPQIPNLPTPVPQQAPFVAPQQSQAPQAVQAPVPSTLGSLVPPTIRQPQQILSLFQPTPQRMKLGVVGAVRIKGNPTVFTLGPGGRPIGSPQDLLSQGFREDEVIEISPEEARTLGIDVANLANITGPINPEAIKEAQAGNVEQAGAQEEEQKPEDFYEAGKNTAAGILAEKEKEMDIAEEETRAKGELDTFQEKIASAGLAFSGIRDKGEQELAAASFARKERISLDLAKTILNAAAAEQKKEKGEIREVGNKLVRIKPDGTVETIYEDTTALTEEKKEALKLQYLGKELELRRQSTLEEKRELNKAGLLYKDTNGSGGNKSPITGASFQTRLNTEVAKVLGGAYGSGPGIREKVSSMLQTEFPGKDVMAGVMARLPDGFEGNIKATGQGFITPDKLSRLRIRGISDETSIWIAEQLAAGISRAEIEDALGDDGITIMEEYEDVIIYGN